MKKHGFVKPKISSPFVSYEEAEIKAPKQMEFMRNQLSDFFQNNVDDDTSLLVLRDRLWGEKDYDWRLIADGLNQAISNGLVLNPRQLRELPEVRTQAPRQSLPDIMKDWERPFQYYRGNK
jgi:hypothetical protein